MANSPRIPAAVANAALDAAIGTVADGGFLRLYDGTQPANGGDAITSQVKLVEFPLNADAFPSATSGLLTANAIGAATAVATGTAAWFRMVKADGSTVLLDGSVGTTDCDLNMSSVSITMGDLYGVTALTITDPQA